MTKIYADGSGWNGKEAKIAVVIRDEFDNFNCYNLIARYEYQLTNNEAEYYAVLEALRWAKNGDIIYTDSQLLVNQVSGDWRINEDRLFNLAYAVRVLSPKVKLVWIPRTKNLAGAILEWEKDHKNRKQEC